MLSADVRLAALERRVRWQSILIIALATVACGPWTYAHTIGWSQDRQGRATYGDGPHLSGATIDVLGLPHDSSGISLISQSDADESFVFFGYRQPDGTALKTMSLSTHWARDRDVAHRMPLTRLNTTIAPVDQPQRDDISLMQCGGSGVVFYPDEPYNAKECPSEPTTVKFNGAIRVKKDVYIDGRIFVNGIEIR